MILIVKSNYTVPPLSRSNIREQAFVIRKALGIENSIQVDPLSLLELILPQVFPDFDYEVLPDDIMKGYLGKTEVLSQRIILPEAVYTGAGDHESPNYRWHRFTVMHEIGHFFLHSDVQPILARSNDYKCYRDPEWQADAFAGEFLVPYHLTKTFTVEEIWNRCAVSKSAAQVQWNAMHKKRAL